MLMMKQSVQVKKPKKQKQDKQRQENSMFNSTKGCKLWKGRSMDKEAIGILNKLWTWFETKSYVPLKTKPCLSFIHCTTN